MEAYVRLKAKHRNLIEFLCVLLGAVFAFSVGLTFALPSLKINASSTPLSTTAYMGNQEYVVVNDSETAPIIFGVGTKLTDVSLKYSICYDFDVRIKYSLEWIGGSSTDNVILTFPNRDNFIVDNSYIFVRDTITAGTGKLNIISAVSFVDSEDETYLGENLSIHIDEVKIFKAQDSYNNNHVFLSQGAGISNSAAATGWFNYKSQADLGGQAYVMVYNYRYDEDHGITDPGVMTSYQRSSNIRPTYGNKYYAGMGVYLVTGNAPIKVKALAVGSWQLNNNRASGDSLVFENNIRYNYSKDWVSLGYQSDNIFENVYYDYIIPAHSTAFINIVDSVEITSVGRSGDYGQYKMITNLTLNDTPFTTYNQGIATGLISSADVNATKTYSGADVTIINDSIYNNYLYDIRNSGARTVPTNFIVTNNSSTAKNVTLTFTLKATISNGNGVLADRTQDTAFNDESHYSRKEISSSNLSVQVKTTSYVAPHTSADVLENYVINSAFATDITSTFGSYDCWVSIDASVSSSSSSSATNLDVFTSISGSNVSLYVKNNTDKVASGTITATIHTYRRTTSYAQINSQPSDWTTNYWNYYILQNGLYIRNTSSSYVASTTYYQKSVNYQDALTKNNVNLKNGFTGSDTTYTSTTLTLQAGEVAEIITFSAGASSSYNLVTNNYATCTSNPTSSAVEPVSEDTDNGYLVNNTNKAYYVRIGGTFASTSADFVEVDGNTLYLGIIRPGQIVRLPGKKENIQISTIEAKDVFTDSDLAAWGDAAVQAIKQYLGDK